VPGIPRPTVEGHEGRFAYDPERSTLVCAGRFHAYEGYTLAAIAFAPALALLLEAETLLLCNSAGALNPGYVPGNLMIIRDHLNFISPALIKVQETVTPVGMGRGREMKIYDFDWQVTENMKEGVYVSLPGPTYETPAETRWLRRAGGDAVGMSTAWEALVGHLLGLTVGGVSLITNMAGGSSDHDEVLRAAAEAGNRLEQLLLQSTGIPG
jgi:purine-nucleoside phosphorylase